ncbi:hypothetical protein HDU78_000302 [Chytriomyces hyalinus]|nr:hypothetical protein HDU78_000302 [Chytriomyces hyalinus]
MTTTSSTESSNVRQLQTVQQVEAKIVQLVAAAGQVVEALGTTRSHINVEMDLDDADPDAEDPAVTAFVDRYKAFMSLLNEIQTMLRPVFRHLARTGILSTANASPISADLSVALERSSLPFRGSTEAFETDLLISVQALNVVCSKIRDGVEMEYGVLLED